MIKLIRRNIKGYFLLLVLSFLTICLLNYIRSLVPVMISDLFRVIEGKEESLLPKLLAGLVQGEKQLLKAVGLLLLGYLIREAINIGSDLLINISGEGISIAAQRQFFGHIIDLPYQQLSKLETGDLIQRATNDINKFRKFLTRLLPHLIGNIAIIFFFCWQIYLINYQVFLVIIIFIPLHIVTSFLYFLFMQHHFTRIEEEEGAWNTIVQENLTGIRIVKAFANQALENEKFDRSINKMITTWDKINRNMSLFWAVSDLFIIIPLIIVFYQAVAMSIAGTLAPHQIIALLLLIQNVLWPARNLGRNISEISRTSIACKRINQILDLPKEYADDGKVNQEIKGKIEYRAVSFQFDDGNQPTLKQVNLLINPGQKVAIVGRTGSGKSTLINLLNRMFDPTEGQLLIDDIPTTEWQKKALRQQISIVSQEPFLYSRTIGENLKVINPSATFADLEWAVTLAAIKEDIASFKEGFQTLIGERGVTLSGGQKQRLAIARALMKECPVLVFDDSLSAVDAETDRRIQEALLSLNRQTTLIITHRINTARHADLIVVMDEGQIVDSGTHQDLITRKGLYQTINNIQSFDPQGGEAE